MHLIFFYPTIQLSKIKNNSGPGEPEITAGNLMEPKSPFSFFKS